MTTLPDQSGPRLGTGGREINPAKALLSANRVRQPGDDPSHHAVLRSPLARIDAAEPIRRRAVVEAIKDALPETCLRGAAELEAARPRPDEYVGAATRAELARRDARLALMADNCRRHARIILGDDDLVEEDQ